MSEVQAYADAAMFRSEEMPFDVNKEGPQVHLLEMSADPLGQIAAACKMYKGEVVRDLQEVTDAERREFLQQIQKTKLKAPFEFVKFHFLFEGVTRSFTHQMVRQRTAVYAQESLRFAVKNDLMSEVALPPTLAEKPEDSPHRVIWENALEAVDDAYAALVQSGMPAEEARGLLPHNVTTRIHYSTDLRALQDHAGNRLCTQAQFEWRQVWARIVTAIRTYDSGYDNAWQYELLADMFRPVCYLTGKCEFMADFDRECSIRDRVEKHHRDGVPSSEWVDIKPAEWLLDHRAARTSV